MSGSEAFDVGGGEQDGPPRLDAARARLAVGDARRGRVWAAAGLGADYWQSPGVRLSWGSLGDVIDLSQVLRRREQPGLVDGAAVPFSGPAAGWVRAEWLRAPLRPEVRALMTLPPGLELLAALQQVGTEPVCPMDHNLQGLGVAEDDDTDSGADADESADAGSGPAVPVPGRTSGWPCGCQLIVAAGWEAMAAWVGMRGADALVAAAGRQPVKAIPERMARATESDPGRNEVAAVLALSPASTDTRLKAARRLATHPSWPIWPATVCCSPPGYG